jgi:hypothetical protein
MPWVKLDDRFFTNPKVIGAGRDARDLYLAGLCYCAAELTDGFVPANAKRVQEWRGRHPEAKAARRSRGNGITPPVRNGGVMPPPYPSPVDTSSPTEKRGRASGAVAPAPHQAVVNAWMAAVGRDPERAKDYGRYVAVGAEMAGRGDTPQDVGNCTRYLATDPWRQEKSKAPALTDVRDALPMWRDSGRPARVAAGPRPNGKPPSGQEYLMRQLALVRQQSERSEEQQRGPDGPRRLPGGPVQAGRHAE